MKRKITFLFHNSAPILNVLKYTKRLIGANLENRAQKELHVVFIKQTWSQFYIRLLLSMHSSNLCHKILKMYFIHNQTKKYI